MTLTVFLRKLISSNYGIVILGIPLPWFKFKRIFQYISNPDLSPYFYMPINYSAKTAFHLPESNSLTFLPIPLDMPSSLPPPSAVTEDSGAISPVTHTKNPGIIPASLLISSSHSLPIPSHIYLLLTDSSTVFSEYVLHINATGYT